MASFASAFVLPGGIDGVHGKLRSSNDGAIRSRETLKKKRSPSPTRIACPYCGEAEEIYIDRGGSEEQMYTEDCSVCCRPRVIHVERGDVPGEIRVWLEREA